MTQHVLAMDISAIDGIAFASGILLLQSGVTASLYNSVA